MFFVRRDGRVKGPVTRDRLRELRRQDRLRMRDEISLAADGPWSRLRDVYDEVLADAETAAADDEFWREDLPPDKPSAGGRNTGAGKRAGGQFAEEGEHGRTWFERLRDTLEGDGAFRQPFRPWSFLAAAVPLAALAAFVAVILVSPAFEPARPTPVPMPVPPGVGGAAAAAPADAVVSPDAADAAAPVAADAAAPGRVSGLDPDHEAAVATLLAAYYAAGDWQSRYQLVVPGERTRRLLQQLQPEQRERAAAGQSGWRIAGRLEPSKLAAAARGGQPVLVETVVDDHAHALYVVFVQDRWRVDWLRSLDTLWLTR